MDKVAASNSLGRSAYYHDMRITFTDNITRALSRDNVVLVDELKGRSVDEYLDELLEPAVTEYNEKQKRADRKIGSSYTDWHRQDKRKGELVYELVMQYGDKDTIGKAYYQAESPESKRAMREEIETVYRKWLKDWQEQHPGMKVLWCTIHFDEENGTPHMHMAVSPIAQGFKRGPAVQVSMTKCLENDGFPRAGTQKEGFQLNRAFTKFRETQEADLIKLGYEIKAPTRGKHDEPEIFREVEAAKDELEATQGRITKEQARLQEMAEKRCTEEQRASKAKQMYDKAKSMALEYVQQAQEAQETAQTATEQAEIARAELEAAQSLTAAHETKAAELVEQHSQQQAQLDQGRKDLHEIDRRLVVKQSELNNIINGLAFITDRLDTAKKEPAKEPTILDRIDKDWRGRKLERPKVTVYEDELKAVKQQAQITPRMTWLQDALKAVILELRKLFKVDDLISPWKERAERAEREAREQQVERNKSDRELQKMRCFIRDRGLESAYEQSQEQEWHHVHHHGR